MAQTQVRGSQVLNNTIQRQDLDTSTVGQALVTKLVQGAGITLSSTGADSGTGDVTVAASVPQGPAGKDAFNTTTGSFTVPASGSTVSVTLGDASWVVIGQMVVVAGAGGGSVAGSMYVTAKSGNQITLQTP